MTTEEQDIRFALGLPKDKPLVEAVVDAYEELENVRYRERMAYKAELDKLRLENSNYREAYHDQWYNQREIEKCWAVLSGYNRKHLELHEAIREYIRVREWAYEENLHCKPDSAPNSNFPPHSTEQHIKGR